MLALRQNTLPILLTVLILVLVNIDNALAVGSAKKSPKQKVAASVKLAEDNIHAGSTLLAMVIVTIEEGWHINSASPADESLIGTVIEAEKINGLDSIEIRYPDPIEKKLDIADNPLEVYEGTLNILLRLKLATDLKPGTYSIPATIHYQACNNSICLAPQSMDVSIPLRIVSSKKQTFKINQELFEGLH